MGAHIANHSLRVAALRVQVRVWIVLRDAPHAGALVPEGRPRQVLSQELRDPGRGIGRREANRIVDNPILVHLVHLVHAIGHLFHLVN